MQRHYKQLDQQTSIGLFRDTENILSTTIIANFEFSKRNIYVCLQSQK